jgi:hypothetical protein
MLGEVDSTLKAHISAACRLVDVTNPSGISSKPVKTAIGGKYRSAVLATRRTER